MRKITKQIVCPSCEGQLYPRVLECPSCSIKVEGEFSHNEFSSLNTDALHFLRVFIHCEGRIRDMEKALGVSYPTVKSRLSSLKDTLGLATKTASAKPKNSIMDALEDLEKGESSFQDVLNKLKAE
ncbi:DUF2089 domain-containing protein [bacterium]|nr:DUF2089 domain-containing protein [bacterium]